MLGEIDSRVRALVFAIRHWARIYGVTNPNPGYWISNFAMSCLVVYYLQRVSNPVLPAVERLIKSCDGIVELKPPAEIGFESTNSDSLANLLLGFFEFYGKGDERDFGEGLCILDAFDLADSNGKVGGCVSTTERGRFLRKAREVTRLLRGELGRETCDASRPWGAQTLFVKNSPSKPTLTATDLFKDLPSEQRGSS